MWLDQVVSRRVSLAPDAVALRDARRELTWRLLDREVGALAEVVASSSSPRDRVLVASENRVEVLVAYLACARAGAVVAPINPNLVDTEVEYVIRYVEPVLAIADTQRSKRLEALTPELPLLAINDIPDLPARQANLSARTPALGDPFGILHTSATTGYPKGAVLSHRSLQVNALSWFADVRPAPETAYLNASPLFHGSMVIALDYLAAGATVSVLDRFTPQGCLAALERWRTEHVLLVPSMIRLILQARALETTDLGALELVLHTAEPMPESLAAAARAALPATLLNVYGITEGGGPVITSRSDDVLPAPRMPGATCAGVPMLGVGVKLVDREGEPLPPGEVGEVCLTGDGIMSGYWERPDATARALRHGWLYTGDLGYRDTDGRVWVVDRRNDLILRGGQNVYPAEIARVLRSAPAVADVGVVAAPSPEWGQTPWAFVQPTTPEAYDEAELLDLVVRDLASYKRPSRFVPVDHIPRGPSGKLLRRVLRERAEEEAAAGSGSA